MEGSEPRWLRSLRRGLVPLVLLALSFSGCAAIPYEYDLDIEAEDTLLLEEGEVQIQRGRPVGFLDFVGHYIISLPAKLILWDWDVDRHEISPETEEALRRYLEENGLRNVRVRLNEYAPGGEFSRLFRNTAVGWFWRYTIGLVSTVVYTILPGRFWGGDNYNPYTNTINLYSDDPAIALHEAGHAKDFARRKWKGSYAALRILPIVPLFQEGTATGDAIGNYINKDDREGQKDAYKILYPAYGTYVGGQAGYVYGGPFPYLINAAFAIPGHIAGRIAAARVEDPDDESPFEEAAGE